MTASEVTDRPSSVKVVSADRLEFGLPWYAVLLICLLPFLFRFHLLSIPFAFNVDEAQWTVAARRALQDPILFRSIELGTSGPLNALPIAWPSLFGLTPSIVTSRLTAFVMQSLTLLGMTTFIRRGEVLSLGTATILAAAMWIALQPHYMLLGYESETLPNFLMVLFCMTFAGLRSDVAPGPRLAVCGLIAGALPFAKMQTAPFAVVFEAACLFRLWMDMRVGRAGASDVLWWLLGSVAPLLLLVVPLFFVGEQDAFFIGYLGLAVSYGAGDHTQILRNAMVFVVVMAVVYVGVIAPVREPGTRCASRLDLLLLSAGIWPAGLYAIWRPGQGFIHYLLFIVIGLPLAVLLAQYALPAAKPRLPVLVRLAAMLMVVVLPCVSFLRHQSSGVTAIADLFKMSAAERAFASPGADARPLYAWTGASGNNSMLLWGYVPELTEFSGLRSAERAAETEYDIRPNSWTRLFPRSLAARSVQNKSGNCARCWAAALLFHRRVLQFRP